MRSCDVTLAMRARVREAIEGVIEEETTAVLGCAKCARSADRVGDRRVCILPHVAAPLLAADMVPCAYGLPQCFPKHGCNAISRAAVLDR